MRGVEMSDLAQGTSALLLGQQEQLDRLAEAFLATKRAEGLSQGTQDFYRKKLRNFLLYCADCEIALVTQITPDTLRDFFNHQRDKGNNEGGIFAHYRTLKTFLYWYEGEFEPEEWKNPIHKAKVRPPKLEPLDPVNYEDVERMIKCCSNDVLGRRNKAMMLTMLDTGARASELLNILLSEIDILSGELFINKGKGGKSRYVYIGEKARKAVRQYLRLRTDNSHYLWITRDGDQLSYWGLVSVFTRCAEKAGIPRPRRHAFRYFFALTSLRNGMDVFSLQKAGGWASMAIMRRYLKQTETDVETAMKKYSPVDNLK
jgi:integrase/recombinase XerC